MVLAATVTELVRPRHASTLILIREDGGSRRVLMGNRSKKHVFMPNTLVYPGCAVDAGDHRVKTSVDLRPEVNEKLQAQARGTSAHGLAMAAVRETFEETGLVLGHKVHEGQKTRALHWAPFFDRGYQPALDKLAYVARAITPPGQNRRFDTRFFVATGDAIAGDPDDFSQAGDELLNLTWYPVEEILESEVRGVTKRGLECALTWLDTPPADRSALPIPYATMARGKRQMVYI